MNIDIQLLPYQKNIVRNNTSLVTGIIGGTGTGKTWLIPRWLLIRMAENPNQEWIVSSPTIGMLKKNPIKYIRKYFDSINYKYIYNKSDGIITTNLGTIYFISAEQSSRMQGIHAKGIVGDEAGQYTREWWETAIQRARYFQGQILLVTTPYTRNWLYKDVIVQYSNNPGDKLYYIERPLSINNPYYNRQEIENAKRTLPPWKFQMMYEGKFSTPQGLIYTPFEQHIVPGAPDMYNNMLIIRGVDYGYNNPTAIVWLATLNGVSWYVIKEFKKSGLINSEIVSLLLQDGKDTLTFIDPSAAGLIEECKRSDINVESAANNVLDGILYVYGLLQKNNLHFINKLPLLFEEANNYAWLNKAGESLDKPTKENDHLMDALRYGLYSYHKKHGLEAEVTSWSIAR